LKREAPFDVDPIFFIITADSTSVEFMKESRQV